MYSHFQAQRFLVATTLSFFISSTMAIGQPQLPSNPQSPQECEVFRSEYKAFLDQLGERYRTCQRANNRLPVAEWRPAFSCSGHASVPPPCVTVSNEWSCANRDFGPLINRCAASVRDHHSRRVTEMEQSLRITRQQPGATDVAGEDARRLARWWGQNTNNATVGALVGAVAKVEGYASTANQIREIFNRNSDPAKRTEELAVLFSGLQKPFAHELTVAAIRGVAATGRQAIERLTQDIAKFRSEVDSARTRAMMDHRIAIARHRAAGADSINQQNTDKMIAAYQEHSERLNRLLEQAEAEQLAFEEEQRRILREHNERMAYWKRLREQERLAAEARAFEQYNQAAQIFGGYMLNFIDAVRQSRSYAPGGSSIPAYRPPPRPTFSYPTCMPGPGVCAVR